MVITMPRERCLLCGYVVDAADKTRHMRTVHQVILGEQTVADVPAGRANWLHVAQPAESHEHELVGAGV